MENSSDREAMLEAGRNAFVTEASTPSALDMFEQPSRSTNNHTRTADTKGVVGVEAPVGFTAMMDKYVKETGSSVVKKDENA